MKKRTLLTLLLATVCAPLMAAHYLIVTNESLKPGFEDLAAYRASPEGDSHTTYILTVESLKLPATIGPELTLDQSDDPPWDDYKATHARAAVIRDAIASYWKQHRDSIGSEPFYVLLGGRADVIPPVQVVSPVSSNEYPKTHTYTPKTGISSDLFYGCLSSPWQVLEVNRVNPKAGQTLPDAVVGRLPLQNVRQIRDYVARMRRYQAKDEGLVPNSILLHGTQIRKWYGTPPEKRYPQFSDGYPWLNDTQNHPRAKAGSSLANGQRVLDAELWLRNTFVEYIAKYSYPKHPWRVDLFFDKAAGDPVTRDRFTDRYSIENPNDINVYLRESPELVLVAAHGFNNGCAKLSAPAATAAGNRWGILYTCACNTAVFDSFAIRGGEEKLNNSGAGLPLTGGTDGQWLPYCFGEHALVGDGTRAGGLVYIASSREGWSTDNTGGVGTHSNQMTAEFAGLWAEKTDWTVGRMFNAHLEKLNRHIETSGPWRALLLGTVYFGDPALRPLRAETPARTSPFTLSARDGDGLPVSQQTEVYAGQTVGGRLTPPAAPGKVFTGWTLNGKPFGTDEPLPYAPDGLTLTASWRDAAPEELRPESAGSVRRLWLEDYEKAGKNPANAGTAPFRGNAGELKQKNPVITKYAQTSGAYRMLSLKTRMNFVDEMWDSDEYCIASVSLPTENGAAVLRLVRRGNRGYAWQLQGKNLTADSVTFGCWNHLSATAGPETQPDGSVKTRLAFYLNGRRLQADAGRTLIAPLKNGNTSVWLGGENGKSFAFGAPNAQWLDDVALFESHLPFDRGQIVRLNAPTDPVVAGRLVLSGDGPLALPDGSDTPLHLTGTGTLALKNGQVLPPLTVDPGTDLRITFPDGGHAQVTEATKQALGLDAFVWTPSVFATFAADSLTWIGEAALRVTDLAADSQTLTVGTEVFNKEGTVSFAPGLGSTAFRLRPVSADGTPSGAAEPALSAETDGARASLSFPAAKAPVRLFRIETVSPTH